MIVQLSQAPPIERDFYKKRGFVLIALSLIEQLAVEAEETALAAKASIYDQPIQPANEGAAMTAARTFGGELLSPSSFNQGKLSEMPCVT